jgi:hypothetical protein
MPFMAKTTLKTMIAVADYSNGVEGYSYNCTTRPGGANFDRPRQLAPPSRENGFGFLGWYRRPNSFIWQD